ncbi:RESISTANCE PROTEIN RGA2 putative-RELATED [Salix viminalis]|uniref:RESISTANCE PROTEIN RGA2 putative-RELATED n=1 Tax=Salix viminalis TaxID=40686 RepID=A0A9Q0QDA1_SALVM|nr:RESISTANCE PROTEIN RGA2 putative-RELATED [Salix viminalis]
MEIVSAVVSKIAELSAEPVIKQFTYMFCFNNFVKKFSEQWRSLDLALHRVQHDVDVAIRNAEEIDNDVNKWLEDAKKALAVYGLQDAVDVATKNAEEIEIDVNKWLEDAKNEMEGENRLENEKGKNGKCFTWCPKWICQFKLSKALEKKTETLRKLEEESKKFQKVGHKEPPQDLAFLPSKEFTPSESSKEAFEQIMKALKDDNVNMIGLYGMGGVGKTTLVREVGRRAKKTQLFDAVLLATVSQNPNVMYIQDRMADNLDLHFDKNTIEGRANQLWQRLKTEKKLLVILDDVWKGVNLKEIGIPFGDDHRGCKVLLTTRRRDICSYMECQPIVFLSILSENEAWALFKINAHLRDEDFNLNTVAKKVARECQGLPIALVTVGRALRGKSVIEWEVASTELKNSEFQHMEQNGEENNAYACLKLSYDYLKHEKTKLCFLLCCLFPEDYDIPIEDLTIYAVSYGLHQDVVPIEDARKQVYVAIKTLKDCCMLLGTETEEDVKMHDLVRDVAIQIASSKEHGFIVKAGIGLKEWPRCTKSFESCKTISLMGNKLAELPEGLVCPQLKVLLLELDDDLKVPERFFEGMKGIEVFSLEGGCLSLQSLEFSTNLQSLLLIDCECNNLIWLRKLPRLEILCFIGCSSVKELPDEIGELKELRLLDVTDCTSLRRIPVNLIGRLKKLEELLIGDDSFKGWDVVGCDSTGGMNASLTELNLLSHLAVLSLKILRVECIPRDFVFPRLLKYDIVLGNGYSRTKHPTSLYLSDISAASLNAKTFEQLFPTVSQIHFRNVEGLENIALSCDQMTSNGHGSQKDFFERLEDVKVNTCKDIRTLFLAKWRQALNNLTKVEILCCESLEVVFELGEAEEGINEEKELRQLSSLTRLKLENLPELKCIWKGPTRHVSLRSLVHLDLRGLDKLTFIFTPHLAQSLVHLETLRIGDCIGLKHLIGEKDDEREIIPESFGFPKLKTLSIRRCEKLEYVFPVSVSPSLLNLENMNISFGANLKEIFYRGEGDALTRDGIINFPQQRKLSLSRPTNFTAQLPSLQVLAIEGHEELGDFLAQLQGHTNLRVIRIAHCKGAHDRRTGHELSLLSLEKLELNSMPDMRCIWKGLVLSCLTYLKVSRCEKLTHVFTGSMVASLVQLQSLDISDCEELEQIIAKDNDDEKGQILSGSDLQSLCFPNLRKVEINGCNKLRSLFPVAMAAGLPKLEALKVRDSSQLLGVFWQDDHASPVTWEQTIAKEKDDEREIIPESLGFPKLKTLSISGCYKLEDVFPVSVSPSLLNLEEITIVCCANLKQIFYSGEGDALTRDGIINFPQLRKLCLSSGCNFFGPKNFTAQFPSLQVLSIDGHEELGDLLAQLQGHSNLREIRMTDCKGAQDRRTGHELSLLSLEKLELNCMRDMRCIWKGLVLSHLTTLKVCDCHKLTHVFTGSMVASLVQLQFLDISCCEELEQIIAKDNDDEKDQILSGSDLQSLCFPNLCEVYIMRCNKLRSLFPVAMAAGLLKLKTLSVSHSSQLLGVFGQDDHASPVNVEKQMVLPNLSFLKLNNLPSIVCFSPGCDDFLLHGHTNLREICITDCKGAQDRRTGHELSNLSLEKLYLGSLPDMRCIWKGLVLSHLTTLGVYDCHKLTHVLKSVEVLLFSLCVENSETCS